MGFKANLLTQMCHGLSAISQLFLAQSVVWHVLADQRIKTYVLGSEKIFSMIFLNERKCSAIHKLKSLSQSETAAWPFWSQGLRGGYAVYVLSAH